MQQRKFQHLFERLPKLLRSSDQRLWLGLVGLILSIGFVYGLSTFIDPVEVGNTIISYIKRFSYPVFTSMKQDTFLTPLFFIGVLTILALEKLFPAKPAQKLFSVSLAQDLIWAVLFVVSTAFFTVGYVHFLETIYHRYFSFLTIGAVGQWPDWVRFVWGVILLDFLHWFQHYLHHKIPWFWHFHAVHHSQRDLNMFTDFRYHVFEYLVRHTVYVFPLLMLTVDTPKIIYFTLFIVWHARLYHSNIKTDFGPLRYIIVTPQSHRVHHSVETKHFDTNFGALLSIWDYLFQTQYKSYNEYPETGINEYFPHEDTITGLSLLETPIAQMIYPFQAIGRSLKRILVTFSDVKQGVG
jgi:sterol desaturase/sphingolipid hydroxylase (fatty acid hydroxylase superfamily)